MKYYLVYENEVVGEADSSDYLPQGFEAVESPLKLNVGDVYWNGKEVVAKPVKPGNDYFWDKTKWTSIETARQTIPVIPMLNDDETKLATSVYEYIKTIDEPLAETIAYLLAKIQDNTKEMELRKSNLLALMEPK